MAVTVPQEVLGDRDTFFPQQPLLFTLQSTVDYFLIGFPYPVVARIVGKSSSNSRLHGASLDADAPLAPLRRKGFFQVALGLTLHYRALSRQRRGED